MNDVAELPAETVRPLTEKMRRLIEEYTVDLDGKAAAIRAGYGEGGAKSRASELLAKPQAQAYLAELNAGRLERLGVTVDRVLEETARIAFSDIRNVMNDNGALVNPKDWDAATAASIASIEVTSFTPPGEDSETEYTKKIKMWDKPRALGDLGKHLGIGNDEGVKVAVQVNISKADAAGF